ncbi:hypothetical protein B0T24DRAFT_104 [Lasiosphaeria ovina]|uniref:Nitronate monooxygenase domain-containing protein n=1 Tax=Lasiosphaeria ovina TaxID=92902 RepID=A0AAE0NIE4_9PEZI|nr:hypothetical protein B0T24DRAFT_104 [Lasiosphaeria ovina]
MAGTSKMRHIMHSIEFGHQLSLAYPWTSKPLLVAAPMRVISGPQLAVAVSRSGGLGFIGPGEKPQTTAVDLESAKDMLSHSPISQPASNSSRLDERSSLLPIGVGFQLWNGDIDVAASAVSRYRPAAAWLFAPHHGQTEVDNWAVRLREACPGTKIWLQVGTFNEAVEAAASNTASRPDVLVVQGTEAGGHGRALDGMGFITLLPEISDAIRGSGIPLFAAGGIADGRGAAAALAIGAAGVVMGTRFLASQEARVNKDYQNEVVRAADGASTTVRTQLYNHLRGTFGWPEQFSPRTIINKSWVEQQAGAGFEDLKKSHDLAVEEGRGWGPEGRTATYAGAGVGLVRVVDGAGAIVEKTRSEAIEIIRRLQELGRD